MSVLPVSGSTSISQMCTPFGKFSTSDTNVAVELRPTSIPFGSFAGLNELCATSLIVMVWLVLALENRPS
jgi:hypothetical protein